MGTKNKGGHVPSVAHNSEESFGDKWWLKSQHLMKEPSTSGKVGKGNQEERWLGAFLPSSISNEESTHLKEMDKVRSSQSFKIFFFLKTLEK